MSIVITNDAGPSLTNVDVSNFETELGVVFPLSFKEFLLKHNGGCCKYDYPYNFEKYDGIIAITNLLGIQDKHSIKDVFQVIQEMHGNNNWLPFAYDSRGWIFCISLKPDSYGKIYLMRTDEDEEDAFRFICNDFQEFVDGLKTDGPAF